MMLTLAELQAAPPLQCAQCQAERTAWIHSATQFAVEHARTLRHQELAGLRDLIGVLAGLMEGKR